VTAVIASIALGLVVLLDVTATVLLVRSTVATPLQKILQLALAWAFPLVGSIIVIAVIKETISTTRSRLKPGSGDEWLPGMGPQSDASSGHHGHHGGGSDVGHGGDAGGH
jgi:hypothetical protein